MELIYEKSVNYCSWYWLLGWGWHAWLWNLLVRETTLACGLAVPIVCAFCLGLQSAGLCG